MSLLYAITRSLELFSELSRRGASGSLQDHCLPWSGLQASRLLEELPRSPLPATAPMLVLATLLLALPALAQERLVRYGPGANDTARVPASALAVLYQSPIADTAHPAHADVDRAFLAALAARPNQFTPGFIDITDNQPHPRTRPSRPQR
ncbi:hypothetical protein AURDEDRAFT_163673 [Auricularia subglabra TFB-10046 SS5]|nr:hypothetical protein AURDEDRAFT_163673 [Auricularia subglabra TFB-10046 SS5]